MLYTVVLLLLVVQVVPHVDAATCYVSTTGNNVIVDCTDVNQPCRDFRFAIESAVPSCTDIFAFGGVYTGVDNRMITGTLPLVLQRFNGSVTIDAGGNNRFLMISQNSGLITNFTFIMRDMEVRNAFTNLNFGGGAVAINIIDGGGGISTAPASLFENVQFNSNTADGGNPSGGALRVENLAVILRNTTFRDNTLLCSTAGGVTCFGGAARFQRSLNSVADYLIEDCVFERNIVTSTENSANNIVNGGGLSIGALGASASTQATILIRRSSFIDNEVSMLGSGNDETLGGALSVVGANLTIECSPIQPELCTFSGNRVFSAAVSGIRDFVGGGAIGLRRAIIGSRNTTTLTMRNVVLFDNHVECTDAPDCGTQYGGGAIASSRISISGCQFCNNSVFEGSGAHILVLTSDDTETLTAGPLSNVFTCNNTVAIEPVLFECGPPECQFLSTVIIDPATDICFPCQLALTPTPTGNPFFFFFPAQNCT